MKCFPTKRAALVAAVLSVLFTPVSAKDSKGESDVTDAQAVPAAEKQKETAALETVTVTGATKRGPQDAQKVAVAVTAFGEQQLQEQNFKTLGSLGYSMPNVQMDDIGTTPGVANFSIRGLGINSSIPSIDPTVGVFVDGVYMGVTSGVLFDNFDMSSVEVLRGPQGILFGRNVTGGAVLINTRTPTDKTEVDARIGVESGLRSFFDATAMGAIVPGVLSGKIAIYESYDQGWFTNQYNGGHVGGSNSFTARGALHWTPSDALDVILRAEHGEVDGNGPAAQNPALFSPDTHRVTSNFHQGYDNVWDQVSVEANWKVGFGDGKITDVFGWRNYALNSVSDIDATYLDSYRGFIAERQEQYSNELRYAGTFGKFDVTAGTYWFTQDLLYVEQRNFDFAPPFDHPVPGLAGGGDGTFSTAAAFLNADWHFTDQWTLNLGVRYSHEKKEADIARMLSPAGGSTANATISPDYPGLHRTWHDISPKVGLQWQPTADTQIYGFWTEGFRSGGYNFRNTVPIPVMAFDSEKVYSYELGIKKDFQDLGLRINADVFHDQIDGLQRESNDPNSTVAIQQIIHNVGDATVQGAEGEARLALPAGFTLSANFGYIDNKYDKLWLPLLGGKITAADYALKLPRAPKWTYGLALINDLDLDDRGLVSTRISYSHRDFSFYDDTNSQKLPKVDMVDLNVTWTPAGAHWSFSVYGENLLNETIWGASTALPNIAPFGGGAGSATGLSPAFRPLDRGRVVGVEARYKF